MKTTLALVIAFGYAFNVAQAADLNADCKARSADLLDHMDRGDYAGATTHFDDAMKKAADGTYKLASLWPSLTQHFGARGTREQPQVSQFEGHTMVLTPMHWGQTVLDAQVACDPDGKIAGFYIKPPAQPDAMPDQSQ